MLTRPAFEPKPSTGQLHVELNGSGPREVRSKTKKPEKPSFFENGEGILKKMFFFLVLPRKKMVLHRKTNFSIAKRWFSLRTHTKPKPSFCEGKVGFPMKNHLLRGKTTKPKKTSFLENRGGF